MLLGQNVKNKLINAKFDLWQRGFSFNLSAAAFYTADRTFLSIGGTSPTGTVTRQALAAGEMDDQDYFLRLNTTVVGSPTFVIFGQRIENVRTLAGKKVTFSVWVRSTIAGKTFAMSLGQVFGSGGSSSVAIANSNKTIANANVITRFDYTLQMPSIVGKTIGTNSYLEAQISPQHSAFGISSIGVGDFDLIKWQLNEGEPADFETAGKNYLEELSFCQRFYEKNYPIDTPPGTNFTAGLQGISGVRIGGTGSGTNSTTVYFKQEKRAFPAMVPYDATGNANRLRVNAVENSTNGGLDWISSTAFTVRGNTGTEILGYWTADAEL